MWPDRVSNPGPLTYELGALPIALRAPLHLAGSICLQIKLCFIIGAFSANSRFFSQFQMNS